MRATRLAAAIAAAAALGLSTLAPVAFATSGTPTPEAKCGKDCSPRPEKHVITATTECSDEGVKLTLANESKHGQTVKLEGTVNDQPYQKDVEVGGESTATETLTLANGQTYSLKATIQVGRKSIEVATIEGTRQCAAVGTPEVECKHHQVLVPLTAGDEATRFSVGDKTVLVAAGETETVKVPIPRRNDGIVKVLVKGPFGDRELTVDVSKCTTPKPEECPTADAGYDCDAKGIHVTLDNPYKRAVMVGAELIVDGKTTKKSKPQPIKPGKLDFNVPLEECGNWELKFTGAIKKDFKGTCDCPDEPSPTPTPSTTTPSDDTSMPPATPPNSTPSDGSVIPPAATPPSDDTPMQPVANDGSLAETGGGSAVPIAAGAGVLLAIGGGTLVYTRRRRATGNNG